MIPIPFASQSYENRSLPVSAQRCFNLYPEIVTEGKSQLVLHGTPGTALFGTGDGKVRGMHFFNGVLYAVTGNSLYSFDSLGNATDIGTIDGTDFVRMADNGTQMAITTGDKGYIYDWALTQITDGDFPTANFVDFINQRMIYDSQFGFTYTELDAAQTMAGTVNGTGSPDQCISILVDHLEQWMFGEHSIEIFYNSGDLLTPFERLQGAFIERGCGAKFTPAKMDNSVYWLGDDFAFYRAEGYTPMRISTPAIEHEIGTYSIKDDAFGFTYTMEGHTFYQVTFPTANKTWVYDAATQRWHERGHYTAGRHIANCYVYAYGKHLIGDFRNGNIYEWSLDTYTDNGDTIQRIAVSPPIHANGEDMFMARLWVDFEPGTGITTGQGSDPQAMLQNSDDGGKTWSNERWTTIGKIGKYRTRSMWRRCGTFVSRMFRLTISDPIKVVIIAAYGDING